MNSSKKKVGRPKSKTQPERFQLRISPELNRAVENAARNGRRSKNLQITIALESYLKSIGLWTKREQKS